VIDQLRLGWHRVRSCARARRIRKIQTSRQFGAGKNTTIVEFSLTKLPAMKYIYAL